MAEVIKLDTDFDWLAYCPECDNDSFQIVVKSPKEPEIEGIYCVSCGYYAEQ